MPTVLLAYYCALILVASIIGGMIPVWVQLTHRWMQFAVSFVAGVMLGIGVLHMLPHALMDATLAATVAFPSTTEPAVSASGPTAIAVRWITISLLAGMLTMFFIERFFSFHHHDVPEDTEHDHDQQRDPRWLGSSKASPQRAHVHSHGHDTNTQEPADLSWSGATL